MTIARKGAGRLAASNLTSQVVALARYVILARLLGPEQLGIAAMIILVAQFFDVVSDAGLDKFLIQSRDGNRRGVNATVHTLLTARGIILGLLVAGSAFPVGAYYDSEVLTTGLLVLAVSPLAAGFAHFDFRRVQRHHDFRLEGTVNLYAEIAGFVATVAAVLLLRNALAAAIGLAVRSITIAILSHAVARRPYRRVLDKTFVKVIFAFGMPLIANGLLLFVGGQGDRILIVNQLGLEELGLYSALLLLVYYPSSMASRFIQSLGVPLIAGTRDSGPRRAVVLRRLGALVSFGSIGILLGFAAVGPYMTPLLYGDQFAQPAALVCAVGLLQAIRFARTQAGMMALGSGHSSPLMWGGLMRLIAFPVVLLVGGEALGLVGITLVFASAEFLANLTMLACLKAIAGLPVAETALQVVALGTIGAILMIGLSWPGLGETASVIAISIAVLVAFAVIALQARAVLGGVRTLLLPSSRAAA